MRLASILLRSFVCGKALQRTARDGQPAPVSCAIQRVRNEALHVGGRARSISGVPLLLLKLPLPVLVKRVPSLRSLSRALAAVARAARSSVAIGLVQNHRDEARHDATASVARPQNPRERRGHGGRDDSPFDQPGGRANEPRCGAHRAGEGEIRGEEGDEGRYDSLRVPVGGV